MPVKAGKSKKTISSNIEELQQGKTHARTQAKQGKEAADKQTLAIALDKARKSGAKIPRKSSTTRPRAAKTSRG
jgi:Family of unknown function (DUF6496)